MLGSFANKAGRTQYYNTGTLSHTVTRTSGGKAFAYDLNGNMTDCTGQTVETTVYIGPHFEVAVSNTQTISTSYYYALGRPVAMRTKEGVTETVYYLRGDHLGSTSVVSDKDGNQVGRASYYPFGEVYIATGTLATDRMFTGQRLDETGLYHGRAAL